MRALYQLRAGLEGVEPEIWRRIQLPSDLTLADLHDVLQAAMGWKDRHDHEFSLGPRRFGPTSPEERNGIEDEWLVSLEDLLRASGDSLRYRYDRAAGWCHEVRLERVLEPGAGAEVPCCLEGRGASPPEECGGPAEYRALCEAAADPGHAAHTRAIEQIGAGFDPTLAPIDEENARLRETFMQCWVGGILPLPSEMADDLPVPHSLVVWLDDRYGTIVGRELVPSAEGGESAVASVVRVLGDSLAAADRAPVRLRVADPELAERLRARLGATVEVVEGPTPELAELREAMAEQLAAQRGTGAEPMSYLDGGRIAPERMARFFSATARLHRARPWECLGRGDLLVVESDSPDLDGAVVLVAGAEQRDFGFLVFDSAADCATFLEGPVDDEPGALVGAPSVATRLVHFERGANVPPPMRREIGRHLWEVADASAYPLLALLDGDGVARHIGEGQLAAIAACCEAVARLIEGHRDALGEGRPASDTFMVEDLPGVMTVSIAAGLRADDDETRPDEREGER